MKKHPDVAVVVACTVAVRSVDCTVAEAAAEVAIAVAGCIGAAVAGRMVVAAAGRTAVADPVACTKFVVYFRAPAAMAPRTETVAAEDSAATLGTAVGSPAAAAAAAAD